MQARVNLGVNVALVRDMDADDTSVGGLARRRRPVKFTMRCRACRTLLTRDEETCAVCATTVNPVDAQRDRDLRVLLEGGAVV